MNKKVFWVITTVILLILGLTGYYVNTQKNKITINNISVKGLSDVKSIEKINKDISDYEATFKFDDSDIKKVNISSIYKITIDDFNSVEKGTSKLIINNDSLSNVIEDINKISANKILVNKDAYIDKENNTFVIKKESFGNQVDYKKLDSDFNEKLTEFNMVFDMSEYYTKPSILSNDVKLLDILNKNNKMIDKVTKVSLNGTDELLDKTIIYKSINVDGTINEDIIKNFVIGLSNSYGTSNKDILRFKKHNGEYTVLPNTSSMGWEIDINKTTSKILDAINNKEEESLIQADIIGTLGDKENPVGKDYVEIDLKAQHQWVIRDGKVVTESDVVTGKEHTGQGTDVGIHTILYKETDSVLRGTNLDGTKYASPVKYWVPFTWPGQGIHDSNWQPGNVYGDIKYNEAYGSHGCVNTPPEIMKEIFDNVEAGMPVIVY